MSFEEMPTNSAPSPLPDDEKPKKWRVAWRMKETGASGHGESSEDKETIEAWVTSMNEEHPDMEHWMEEIIEPEGITQVSEKEMLDEATALNRNALEVTPERYSAKLRSIQVDKEHGLLREYQWEITRLQNMAAGGRGYDEWREKMYKGWKDEDFQRLLRDLGEPLDA